MNTYSFLPAGRYREHTFLQDHNAGGTLSRLPFLHCDSGSFRDSNNEALLTRPPSGP